MSANGRGDQMTRVDKIKKEIIRQIWWQVSWNIIYLFPMIALVYVGLSNFVLPIHIAGKEIILAIIMFAAKNEANELGHSISRLRTSLYTLQLLNKQDEEADGYEKLL